MHVRWIDRRIEQILVGVDKLGCIVLYNIYTVLSLYLRIALVVLTIPSLSH